MLACMAAAGVAAAVLLVCAWPWRCPHPRRAASGAVLGVAAGLYVGCWLLGLRPHWPPTAALDRLLFIVIPLVISIELAAPFAGRFRLFVWLPRVLLAAVAARIALHGTVYITDFRTPDTPKWTTGETWLILGGLGAALAFVWIALVLLMRRTSGRSLPLSLALTSIGAAATNMLSGYATDVQLGLALAASLTGAVAASLIVMRLPDLSGLIGVGIVCVFSLLAMGRFFAELSTTNAVILLLGPLLCWLPELPPRLRGLGRALLVAVPVAIVVALALQQFVDDSARNSASKKESSAEGYEPTLEDYEKFKP